MTNISLRLNLVLVFMTVVGLFLCCPGFAQTKPNPVNGLWADSNSTAFSNTYAIFSVDEQGKLVMTHYLEYNGTPMVEKGIGFYSHGTLNYDVIVTKGIPGWSLKGQHVLTLSEDGNTLRGHYKDEKGNTGPLILKRLRP
ncbi:MAG TPA: hypothetical protein VK750_05015 [Cytophagaceae bacterium]|jgi:hypothetical protein|nr:hypothetical protein [Cytophagaceae bacterium]